MSSLKLINTSSFMYFPISLLLLLPLPLECIVLNRYPGVPGGNGLARSTAAFLITATLMLT